MRRHAGRRELAVFATGYLTYFGVRAVTEGRVDDALENAAALLHLEQVLGIAWEGAIQSVVAGSQTLQAIVNAIYIYGHWPVLIAAGILLFRYRRDHYYMLRNACLITGLLGLFVFHGARTLIRTVIRWIRRRWASEYAQLVTVNADGVTTTPVNPRRARRWRAQPSTPGDTPQSGDGPSAP